MAGRGYRAHYYPGIYSLSVFSAQGSNPLQDCKLFGKGVNKVYDKAVKGYVYCITGGLQSKLQLPKVDSRSGFQLLHPFLLLQLYVPQGVHFSFELRVSDTNNTRRKMYFSTSFSDIKSTPLHCQIPICMVIRNKWLSLAFHVADLFNSCFRGGVNFRSIDVIVLGPVCKLRKIFTMRCRITETDPKGYSSEDACGGDDDGLPQEHLYAAGVDTCVQTLDMLSIKSALLNPNATEAGPPTDRDSRAGVGLGPGLSARKGAGAQPAKAENANRSVHVAFGTRMPLPLSTVQINTNLPHDKSPTFVKDRVGRVHFVSDPAVAAAGVGGGDVQSAGRSKHAPPVNMISRVLSVASVDRDSRLGSLQLTKTTGRDRSATCCPMIAEESEERQQMEDSGAAAGTGYSAEPLRENTLMTSQQHSSRDDANALGSNPVAVEESQSVERGAAEGASAVTVSTMSTSTGSKSPSKWAQRKKEMQQQQQQQRLKQQQRKEQRAKEYKHSRYMDSPPGSPPCGWDRCIGGDQSEDASLHDHFLEGSWMNSQLQMLSESGDADMDPELERKSSQEEDALMFDIHDDRFFPGHPTSDKKKDQALSSGLFSLHSLTNEEISTGSHMKGLRDSLDWGEAVDLSGDFSPDSSMQDIAGSGLDFNPTSGFGEFKLSDLSGGDDDDDDDDAKCIVAASAAASAETAPASKSARISDRDSDDRHTTGTFPSARAQRPLSAADGEKDGTAKSPDDDLDLPDDPSLDCYYDPKANRYYDLKYGAQ